MSPAVKTELFIRDPDGNWSDPLSDFITFDSIVRRRDVGSWSIKMLQGKRADALSEPGAGIVVVYEDDEDNPLLTGPMNVAEPQGDENGDLIVISGLSDECYLWDRAVWPCAPNFDDASGQVFATDAYDVQPGPAESVAKHYVDFNLGDPSREVVGVDPVTTAIDFGRGLEYIARGRFQILGELIQQICVGGGDLGFSIVDRVFDIFEPNDLSDGQVFSVESGNLRSYDIKTTAPLATSVMVAGGDQDVLRTFVQRSDPVAAAKWRRNIEEFMDRRDTTDLTEMSQAGDQELVAKAEVTTVDLKVIDVPNRTFRRDWNVGDYVTVQDINAVIREASLTLDENGQTVTPTVDSVTAITAQSVLKIFDAVRALKRRVSNLERTL